MQHTSGPWESLGCGVIQVGRDNVTIAKAQKSGKFGHKFPPGQAEANARLMAASPDLLVAAKAALELLEALRPPEESHRELIVYNEICGQLVEAIRKVEGE